MLFFMAFLACLLEMPGGIMNNQFYEQENYIHFDSSLLDSYWIDGEGSVDYYGG
jgi:hypothetical protein